MKKKIYSKPNIKKKKVKVNFVDCVAECGSGYRWDSGRRLCIDGLSCFLAGTKILMGDNTSCPIENVKSGDKIISYDLERSEFRLSIVNKLIVHQNEPSGFYLINNHLKVTGSHRIWVKNKGWISVSNLKIGDEVFTSDGKYITVRTKEKVNGTFTVYNLSIQDRTHNFFAEGILVHNIKACSP